MTISLKHSFTNPKADGGDTTIARPSDWNAEHVLTMASGFVLGRTTAGAGAAEELSATTVRAFLELGTGDSPQFTAVNVGHASDTTLERLSAGVLGVEGIEIPTIVPFTFTPTLSFTTPGDVSVVYGTADARGFKIGKLVFITSLRLRATPTFTTASGALVIGGLQHPVVNTTAALGNAGSIEQMKGITFDSASFTWASPTAAQGTSTLNVKQHGSGQNSLNIDTTNVVSGAELDLWLAIAYEAAA